MSEKKISIYRKITDTKSQNTFTIDDFLTGVKNGHWEDCVLQVRTGKKEKKQCQAVTVAGVFEERKDDKLKQHSGFIAVDVDYKDFKEKYTTDELKSILCKDQYTYSCFVSISGYGLVVIVKIDPKHHREIFRSLENYYYEAYGVPIDPTSVNESRPRFVSYDTELFRNNSSQKYTHRLKPKVDQKKNYSIPFTNSDIDHCIAQIQENGIDITGDYPQWRDIGMALASQYGESGRDYFLVVSQNSPKFNEAYANDQYTKYCKHDDRWAGNKITIASFFRYCKLYGVEITDKTKQITSVARQRKQGKAKKEEVKKQIVSTGIAPPDDPEASGLVDQVYNEKAGEATGDDLTQLEKEELFLKTNYKLEFNEITHRVENNRIELTERDFNSIWRKALHEINEKVNFNKFYRLMHTDIAESYHPIKNFLEHYAKERSRERVKGTIERLAKLIPTHTGKEIFDDYCYYFLHKWIIGLIASVYGTPNALWLIFVDNIGNTGKTYFGRYLLPKDLRKYVSETDFLQGKDDMISMCENLLMIDDEIQGKQKDQEQKLKSYTSKDFFTVRAPYGKGSEKRPRLASLFATSNDYQILNDPSTRNRRYIPIALYEAIDLKKFDAIDKIDLIIEAYYLYHEGIEFRITNGDIKTLEDCTEEFKATSVEGDLLWKYFRKPKENENIDIEYMTTTDISLYLQEFGARNINIKKLGMEIKNVGFERVKKKGRYCYKVIKTGG